MSENLIQIMFSAPLNSESEMINLYFLHSLLNSSTKNDHLQSMHVGNQNITMQVATPNTRWTAPGFSSVTMDFYEKSQTQVNIGMSYITHTQKSHWLIAINVDNKSVSCSDVGGRPLNIAIPVLQ